MAVSASVGWAVCSWPCADGLPTNTPTTERTNMNAFKLATSLAILSVSCQSVHESAHRAVYTTHQASDFIDQDFDGFDRGATSEVGLMYGGEAVGDRFVGLFGDIALSSGSATDTVMGSDVEIDHVGVRAGIRHYFDTGTKWAQPFVGLSAVARQVDVSAPGLIMGGKADDFTVGGQGTLGIESDIGRGVRLMLGYSITGGLSGETDAGSKFDLDTEGVVFGIGWGF